LEHAHWGSTLATVRLVVFIGTEHGHLQSSMSTWAALGYHRVIPFNLADTTVRLRAEELAFRLGTLFGFITRQFALSWRANRTADRFWRSAHCSALSRSADSLARRAIVFFAYILRASDNAFGFLAFNETVSARSFLTLNLTIWRIACRMASCRAFRIITLPTT